MDCAGRQPPIVKPKNGSKELGIEIFSLDVSIKQKVIIHINKVLGNAAKTSELRLYGKAVECRTGVRAGNKELGVVLNVQGDGPVRPSRA